MRTIAPILILSFCFLIPVVAVADESEPPSDSLLLVCHDVVDEFQGRLKRELTTALRIGDAAHAIGVCQISAPSISAQFSTWRGWSVGRTAQRLRNSLNAPDAFDSLAMTRLISDSLDTYHTWTTDSTGQQRFRYLSAIRMGAPCVGCHGDPERFSGKVRAALSELYPLDEAVGFKPGELRGAFTVSVDWPQGRYIMDSLWLANRSPDTTQENGD